MLLYLKKIFKKREVPEKSPEDLQAEVMLAISDNLDMIGGISLYGEGVVFSFCGKSFVMSSDGKIISISSMSGRYRYSSLDPVIGKAVEQIFEHVTELRRSILIEKERKELARYHKIVKEMTERKR